MENINRKLLYIYLTALKKHLLQYIHPYHFFILENSFLPRTLETPLLATDPSSVGKHFSCRALYNNSASFVFPTISFSSS